MQTFRHMNANPLAPNKLHILEDPDYIVEEKFKGIRAFAYITEEGTKLQTRGGEMVHMNFPHLAEATSLIPMVLDGELFADGFEDEVVAGWANSTYLTADTSPAKFHCFDIVSYDLEDLTNCTLLERQVLLESLALSDSYIKVKHYPIILAMDYYEEVTARGGEGVMLKNLQATYKQGKRPQNHWFKLKKVNHYDVFIMGWKPGQGKYEGLVGSLTYGMYVRGKPEPLGQVSGFDDDLRKWLTDNIQEVQRKVIEVKAAGQDKKSLALIEPSFIRFRNDKEASECLLTQM